MTPSSPSQRNEIGVQQGGPISPITEQRRIDLRARVELDLWKAVWEASQVMSTEQIQDHVLGTLREIESDEP